MSKLKNYLYGASTVFSLFPSRNTHKLPVKPYNYASIQDTLKGDWATIGNDLWKVINREQPKDKRVYRN